MFLIASPTQILSSYCFQSVQTRPTVYDLSFVFSTPHHPKMHYSPYHASIQEMVR